MSEHIADSVRTLLVYRRGDNRPQWMRDAAAQIVAAKAAVKNA